jgi:hypothetical protein
MSLVYVAARQPDVGETGAEVAPPMKDLQSLEGGFGDPFFIAQRS